MMMESTYRVVKAEDGKDAGTFAIMNVASREVLIAGLSLADLEQIMGGCLKWIEAGESP